MSVENSVGKVESEGFISEIVFDSGTYLLMDDINSNSIRQVVNFILDHNLRTFKRRVPRLNLIINSDGGSLSDAFALVDIIQGSKIPVSTIGIGSIASAGLVIFMAGTKGSRILTPNTSILSHQYSWGSSGKEHELYAAVKEFELTSSRLLKHYLKFSKFSTEEEVRKILLPEKDVWLSADEALRYGICDEIKLI